MQRSASSYQRFYYTREGWIVKKIIRSHISSLVKKTQPLEVAGLGYTLPYLDIFKNETCSKVSLMPGTMGGISWPKGKPNKTALITTPGLPLANNSMDMILAVHFLEHAEYFDLALKDIYRALKSNGRLILIVPNRTSMWARRDWSPFGHGRPFSASQIENALEEALFSVQDHRNALFMPPVKWRLLLKAAWGFERFGNLICPAFGGVHCIDAVKQVYAPVHPAGGTAVRVVGGKKGLAPIQQRNDL